MKTGFLSRIGVASVLTIAILAGCHIGADDSRAKFTKNEELTAPLAGIDMLSVNVRVGRIEVTAADVGQAKISAGIEARANTEEKAQKLGEAVRIEAEPSGHSLVVKVVKPRGFGRNDPSVNLTITVPASLGIKAEINVGDIRVAGFGGPVEARGNVGAITCTGLRDRADLHTNVGDVRAEYASDAPAAISIDASANVGNVELTGPQDLSAKVSAESNVGSVSSDRPVTVSGHLKQAIRGAIGAGEGRINLRSNVGSVRIR